MPESIYAVFRDSNRAESAAGALLDHGVPTDAISLIISEDAKREIGTSGDPELAFTLPTVISGPAGHTDRFDPLGNDIRNAGEVPVMSGEIGPRGEAPLPSENERPSGSELDADAFAASYRFRTPSTTDEPGSDSETDAARPIEVPLLSDEVNAGPPPYDIENAAKHGITTTTPQDAAKGAVKGAGLGLAVGALAAISAISIPGFGLIIGGGTLATALAGLAATAGAGALAGAAYGYMKDQGVPAADIRLFRSVYDDGGAILTVHDPDGIAREVIDYVLRKYGAEAVVRYGYIA